MIPYKEYIIKTIIPEVYCETKENIVQEISQIISLNITTVVWTSRAAEGDITVTTHFIRNDWPNANFLLQTHSSHKSHSDINIAGVLKIAIIV